MNAYHFWALVLCIFWSRRTSEATSKFMEAFAVLSIALTIIKDYFL